MTEEEAKTKWCPFAQSRRVEPYAPTLSDGAEFKDADSKSISTSCLGSQCMAWREINPTSLKWHPADDREATVEPKRPEHIPESWLFRRFSETIYDSASSGWLESEEAARKRLGGYCGLAGKP